MHVESIVSASIDRVMHVITSVQAYPEFLPGCQSVLIIDQSRQSVVAKMLALGHFFTTTHLHWTSHQVFLKNDWVRGQWLVSTQTYGTSIRLDLEMAPHLPWIIRMLLSQYAPIMQQAFEQRLVQCKP